ncbi:hypothetical protein ACJXDE_05665 [Enterococcus faecium]|uniref:hypothetical protein n=1 Tax=Enterococcus faecium TaxID=1352 RepID=UPI0038D46737
MEIDKKTIFFFIFEGGLYLIRDISTLLILILTFFCVGIILRLVVMSHPELLRTAKEIVINRMQRF